jgi:hypothetical protein
VFLVRYELNFYIVACRPVAGRRPRGRQRDNSRATQRPAHDKEVLLEAVFYMWSASRLYHATKRVSAVQLSEVK